MASQDELYMSRALELARSVSFTSPNPRVGAVLVRDGVVISEGAHRGAGTPHAEVVALDGVDATGATLFVNLEPCTHHGRTPPCAPALAEAGVARVVAAVADPDERVSGSGFDLLRGRDVEVTVGVLGDEAEWLNAPFLHHRRTGRSYVTLKLALTLDGRLGAPDGTSRWITSPPTRDYVHQRRREVDAIMVGSGTISVDDPSLTARGVEADRQPAVVIVDGSGSVAPTAAVFGEHHEVIVATDPSVPHERQVGWKESGAEVLVIPSRQPGSGVDLDALIEELGRRGMLEIYCEGGAGVATSLLRADLVDRLEVHHGAVTIGAGGPSIGDLGALSMKGGRRWKLMETKVFDDDVVAVYARAA